MSWQFSAIRPPALSLVGGLLAGSLLALVNLRAQSAMPSGITTVPGVRVGHVTLDERPTGCTVVLLPPDTVGAVDQRGGAPGTVETDLLRPENTVSVVHAVLLTGGSAFGLDARTGVMKYLEEQKIGFPFGGAYVPIVTGAVLFDLPVGGHPEVRPDARCGYDAARQAHAGSIEEGSVGAGAGATVGKFGGGNRPMKGGIGTAAFAHARRPDCRRHRRGQRCRQRHRSPHRQAAGRAPARPTARRVEDPFSLLRSGAAAADCPAREHDARRSWPQTRN